MVTSWQRDVLLEVAKDYEAKGKLATGGVLRMIAAKLMVAENMALSMKKFAACRSKQNRIETIEVAKEYEALQRTTIYG